MKANVLGRAAVWVLMAAATTGVRAQGGTDPSVVNLKAPRVFAMNGENLVETRLKAAAGDAAALAAVERARERGEGAMEDGPWTVTANDVVPPSGDKHDYQSQAPYWWPNPDKADGLPYIQKDGYTNPEAGRNSADKRAMGQMTGAVGSLAQAYWHTRDEKYAERAAQILRTWFLDPETKMNPHLNFGQAIPGVTPGRGRGLIDTRGLPGVCDAVGLLEGSKAWTAADQKGMEQWFGDFMKWMLESEIGKDEAAAKNNHGSFYDLQVVVFALFSRNDAIAKEMLESVKTNRIAKQFEPDGRQPEELRRKNAWGYSVFNLEALVRLAEIGERNGVDLWRYETADGRSIKKGIDYMLSFYLDPQKEWKGTTEQLREPNRGEIMSLVRRGQRVYQDPAWEQAIASAPAQREGRGRRGRSERATTTTQERTVGN